MELNIDDVALYLQKQIREAKEKRNEFIFLKDIINEALWQGELTAFLSMVSYLFMQTDNQTLKSILQDMNNY